MILYICLQMYNKLCYEDRISAFKFTGPTPFSRSYLLFPLTIILFFFTHTTTSAQPLLKTKGLYCHPLWTSI